jgi:thymidylate synthase
MKQYLDLLDEILENGVEKESGRVNMPNTFGISKGEIKMNLLDGFPLLTTKKMFLKGIIHELLWFLRGDTNIKYLVDNDVNIWNGDAYRWYLKKAEEYNAKTYKDYHETIILTIEEFLEAVKSKKGCVIGDYRYGDLGKVYGYQWRNQNGVDQIKNIIDGLKDNPYSRYHILNAWNAADFKDMALPPCHLMYQFIVRPLSKEEWTYLMGNTTVQVPKFYLDLNMYQRSCDTFLGVPFNLASMSLLLMIIAKASNMIAGVATWIGGDTHLYVNHLPMVKEQLERTPHKLPKLYIKKELNSLDDILALTIDDFELVGYEYHPPIKAELFTGLKK